ncbi:MAG: DegT/DnrJ/EryC1/StrS family aminotransferase, partial [Bacteroidales bacterium]
PKTRVILPVHIFGQCSHMEAISELAGKYNLFVIEDTAQALGTNYIFSDRTEKKAGTIGNIGCVSFFPSKNLGCYGDGGAIITNDSYLAEKLNSIVNHGMSIKYHYDRVGVNSRLDSLQAAILRVKLKHLDEYNRARQAAAEFYDAELKGSEYFDIPHRSRFSTHIFHQYTLTLKGINRKDFMEFLKSRGVPTMVYYPSPLHLQPAYSYLNYKPGDFPQTEFLCDHVVSLPMHTELENDQMRYITDTILEFVHKL